VGYELIRLLGTPSKEISLNKYSLKHLGQWR
jgi:hypothetical protein